MRSSDSSSLITHHSISFSQRLGGHFRLETGHRISACAALCGRFASVLVLVVAIALSDCGTRSRSRHRSPSVEETGRIPRSSPQGEEKPRRPVRDIKNAPAIAGASALPLPLSRRFALPELAPGNALHYWLPGFVGPCPSATLDKSACYSIAPKCTMPPAGCQRFLALTAHTSERWPSSAQEFRRSIDCRGRLKD
jgi:hypothetical protein